ncbi:hypothetical protein NDU88_004913 [Pleurodeles waltl]|uniref:Uncharacterized protein n=1 Tax=Pleurodeles waltl TaxID=8319 RepID=A0AAV7T9G8_PLEWA|nr:hypothetical protein NDU88_004913 [Pleurodeles waltl]
MPPHLLVSMEPFRDLRGHRQCHRRRQDCLKKHEMASLFFWDVSAHVVSSEISCRQVKAVLTLVEAPSGAASTLIRGVLLQEWWRISVTRHVSLDFSYSRLDSHGAALGGAGLVRPRFLDHHWLLQNAASSELCWVMLQRPRHRHSTPTSNTALQLLRSAPHTLRETKALNTC